MQAMPSHLRPMGLSDLLDGIFWVYRKGFFTFLGAIALISLPLGIVQTVLSFISNQSMATIDPVTGLPGGEAGIAGLFAMLLILLVALVQAFIAQPIVFGAVVWATAQHAQGHPLSIRGAYGYGTSRMFGMIGVTLLMALLAIGVFAVPMLLIGCGFFSFVAGAAGGLESGDSSALGGMLVIGLIALVLLLLTVAVWAFLSVRFIFTYQAVVLEGTGAISAFRRSWGLTRGSFWRIFGITLLVGLLITLVSFVISIGLNAPILWVASETNTVTGYSLFQSLSTLVSSIVSILIFPFYGIFLTLFYYDLRVRKEGYDLQVMLGKSSAQPTREAQ